MASRRHVQYTPLAPDDMDEDHGMLKEEDLRFAYNPKALDRVPWKSIALALFLLALGSALIILSFFIFAGHMEGERSQAYGLLTLGVLAFLPGFYETRIAYYSWRGAPGYRVGKSALTKTETRTPLPGVPSRLHAEPCEIHLEATSFQLR